LSLTDDSYAQITLIGGNTVAIYTNRTNVIYVGSNGYLTMNSGDTTFSSTYASHFSRPRVSAFFRDLNPGSGGTISWKQLTDRLAVTYQAVPVYGSTTQTNSFQVELFFSGTIRITYLNLNAISGLVGLSAGTGQPINFVASDYTTYTNSCGPQPPAISLQPASQTIPVGGTATFTINAIGSSPLSYFWRRNGSFIVGATNATYSTNNVQLADTGSQFSCVVSNAYGTAFSSNAVLTVSGGSGTNISITPASPTTVDNCIPFGDNTEFGFTGFIYRNVPGFSINPGAKLKFDLGNTNDLDIRRNIYIAQANLNPAAGGASQGVQALGWTKIVSDSQIPTNPRGNTTVGDYELTYTIEASFSFSGGGLILGFGGSPPGSFADSTCDPVLVGTTAADASGNFHRRFFYQPDQYAGILDAITNSSSDEIGGFIIESTVTPPTILAQPQSQTVAVGSTATFSVTASGTAPLSYFWRRNSSYIIGATNSAYSTNNVQATDSGTQFSCLVSNAYGTAVSSNATLTASGGCGSPIVINFDDVAAPANFAATMRLTNQYAARGVIFAGPGGLDGGAILNSGGSFGVTGFSGTNFLAFNTSSALSGGGIPQGPETIYFSQPMNYVSLLAGSGSSAGQSLTVSAYDVSNVLLMASTVTLAPALTNVQVVGTGISKVVVSSPAPVFVLDDLTFVATCSCTPQSNYVASQTFLDGIGSTSAGIAFDGTNYWSVSGGDMSGNRLARYDAAGNLIATYAPGLDFRSIFTDAAGAVYARAYSSSTIYRQTAPGVFPAQVVLSGGTLDAQSSVVFNANGTEFVAMIGGVVSRWSTNGTYIGSVNLSGFGAYLGENIYPQNRGIAVGIGYWLTYNTNQMLSFWDSSGNRAAQAILQGAGTNFDSSFSLSYCNGQVFVVDISGGTWRGYQLCAGGGAPSITQQPATQTVPVGGSAAFSVTASGTSPLNYFWRRNGSFIAGATNSAYSTNIVQLSDSGSQFSCVVTNYYGMTTSAVATLTVVAIPPSITLQPTNQTVAAGATANFTVSASGSTLLSYFWRRNGVSIPGAVSSSYNLANAQVSDSGSQFSCVVTNIAGSVTSSMAVLKVDTTVANDQCSGALVISGLSYTNAQYTTNATSTGDLVPDCVPGFGNGVWYRFTPVFSGQLEVNTFGSDFDTGLALYTGACGSWTQVACNDDTGGLTSQIITNVSAGTTYYILAGGYSGYTGHLLVHLALTLPVDHFAWNTIPSPKSKNVPFGVTITAQDVNNQAVANFTGTVMLGGRRGGSSIVFSATFDNGSDGFIYLPDPDASSNLWHSTTHRFVSPSNCQYYGKEGSWNYDTGARNAGNLQSPVISLAGAIAPVTLAFKYLLQTEGGTIWDQATVAISGDGGTTWSALTSTTNLLNPLVLTSSFTNRVVDISAYAGSNIVLRFNFDTIDAGANTFEGWYVDDVNVTATTAAVAITPTNTGSFINGVWAGNVAVLEAATNMYLVATDSLGRSGSSSPFQVVSNSVITQVTLLPGGSIQITLAGSSGDIYRVLGSTNLLNWQTIASVTNVTGTVQFTDPGATNFNRRFYRLVMP
jgi:hypothetical protein